MKESGHREVTLFGWQDVKVQLLYLRVNHMNPLHSHLLTLRLEQEWAVFNF